jgi:hypothetical protein
VNNLPTDRAKKRTRRQWTRAELRTLYMYAKPRDRAIMTVGLNVWNKLLERVEKDHRGFHGLLLKHLRKTGANLLRHTPIEDATLLAAICLPNGEKNDGATLGSPRTRLALVGRQD